MGVGGWWGVVGGWLGGGWGVVGGWLQGLGWFGVEGLGGFGASNPPTPPTTHGANSPKLKLTCWTDPTMRPIVRGNK
jgi:hypothetical protein